IECVLQNEVSDDQRAKRLRGHAAGLRGLRGEKASNERHVNQQRVLGEPAVFAQVILVVLKKGVSRRNIILQGWPLQAGVTTQVLKEESHRCQLSVSVSPIGRRL